MALMVMDWDFRLKAELALPESYQLTRSYYGVGAFEVRMSERALGVEALVKDAVVFFSDALHKAAILEKITVKDGKVTATGKLLKGIVARRICVPPTMDDGHFGWDRFKGSAEAAYHHYAAANLYAPEDAKRAIPRLIGTPHWDRGDVLPWQSRFGELHMLFNDIGETTQVGWDIVPDFGAKHYRFTTYLGRDFTKGVGRVVIAEHNQNASGIIFTQDGSACKTTAYIGGEGEDENRLIISHGNEAAGVHRRETWVDAGSLYETETLRLAGQNKLDTSKEKETLTADLTEYGLCRYERDFDIGDKVILAGSAAKVETRLLEVRESYADGGRKLQATFGDAPVSFMNEMVGLRNQMVR